MEELFGLAEPFADGLYRLAQTRKRRLGRIQLAEPATQGGGIGHAIRVFDGGCRSFPGMALQEVAL